MYGGTAKTYCEYEQLCEPYKEGKVYYIDVVVPKTGLPKKVRWYTDKAHADLMPKKENPYGPFYHIFGFENTEDSIWCIKWSHLVGTEQEDYFGWRRGWKGGMFFGGIWYATKDVELPPIKNKDKIFECSWPEFKKAGQEHLKKLNPAAVATSDWFREDEEY